MITTTTGDILQSTAQTLVNTVNTVGVMGKGIAAAFKERYPEMFKDYKRRCERPDGDPEKLELGRPYLWRPDTTTQLELTGPTQPNPGDLKWVLNFPTKDHWRGASRLDAIEDGLDFLVANYQDWGIESIAVPPLGCGWGGLEWKVVGPRLYERLSELAVPVELYAPLGTPRDQLDEAFLRGDMDHAADGPQKVASGDLAVVLMALDVADELGVDGLNQRQTRALNYLASAAGIPTASEHVWDKHGLRDINFSAMMRQMERNGVATTIKSGPARLTVPGPTASDSRRLLMSFLSEWEDHTSRLRQTAVALGPRLLADAPAVHWVARTTLNDEGDVSEIRRYLGQAEGSRRSPSECDVAAILDVLRSKGFLDEDAVDRRDPAVSNLCQTNSEKQAGIDDVNKDE